MVVMNRGERLLGLMLAVMLLTTPLWLYADDHERVRQWLKAGYILSLTEILAHIPKGMQGHILEVELEGSPQQPVYELEILDATGVVWELILDARTGMLLTKEQDK